MPAPPPSLPPLRQALLPYASESTHAGLWLDRFPPPLGDVEKAKHGLFSGAAELPEPPLYPRFFERWEEALRSLGAATAPARASGRLVIGLGSESVLETSITLHRVYGVPYIPGSALKGLARGFAHRRLEDARWREGGQAHAAAFGTQEAAGHLTFHDALYMPGTGHARKPLAPDVLTVHHPDYYRAGDGGPAVEAPAADWDSPIPVHFLTATGSYLLAVSGPPLWARRGLEILAAALAQEGVGAKTSRGYGRLSADLKRLESPSSAGGAGGPFPSVEGLSRKPLKNFKSDVQQYLQALRAAPSDEEKGAISALIRQRIDTLKWKDARDKPWYQELL